MQRPSRHHCHACASELHLQKKPGRGDECPGCGAELRVCLNCAYYDASLSRGCREPQAEEVRDVARANFCGWFVFRDGAAPERPAGGEEAKAAFDRLFGRGAEGRTQSEGEGAKAAFDALFKPRG